MLNILERGTIYTLRDH